MRLLGDLLVKNAIEAPEKVAVVHRGRRVTYRELVAEAHRAAVGFHRLHGVRGNRIAILLPNCPEFLVTYFGAVVSGNIAVPLDYTLPSDELPYLLNNSQASCLVTSREFLPKLSTMGARATALRSIVTIDEADGLGEGAAGARCIPWPQLVAAPGVGTLSEVGASPDEVVVFLYTSGTTGLPRAAMCTHRNLMDNVATEATQYGLGRHDVFSCVLPMFHNYSIVDTCLLPLWYGATIVISEPENTEQLLRDIEVERVTFLASTPAQLSEMAFHRFSRDYDTSSLRMVQTGGASLPVEVQARFQERYHLPIIEGYGCSEASSTVTVVPMQGPYKPSSVGRVMPNQQIRVVDAEDREARPGELGEVIVRGPNVCHGYYGLPDVTATAFRNGWLHTGDLGRIDEDGFLFVVGRMESTIVMGGLSVYPVEVENALRQIEGVLEACVVASVDEASEPIVKAFVETEVGTRLEEMALIEHCRRVLAPHKVPRKIEFRDRLPRTGIGKISRRRLLSAS